MKRIIYFIALTIISSCSPDINNAFAQEHKSGTDDFAFTLIEPTQNDTTVNIDDKIPVKITFNANAVNAVSGWIMTRIDGKMIGVSASTTMESPFTDEIPASYLKEGVHKVEYLVLPPGQSTDKIYAQITLNVKVESSSGIDSKKSDAFVDGLANSIIEAIKQQDSNDLEKLCINKTRLETICNSITGTSSKDKSIKAELEAMDPYALQKTSTDKFEQLIAEIKSGNVDSKQFELVGYEEKDINLEMPEFRAMNVAFRIQSNNASYTIRTSIFCTSKEAFIFKFKYSRV